MNEIPTITPDMAIGAPKFGEYRNLLKFVYSSIVWTSERILPSDPGVKEFFTVEGLLFLAKPVTRPGTRLAVSPEKGAPSTSNAIVTVLPNEDSHLDYQGVEADSDPDALELKIGSYLGPNDDLIEAAKRRSPRKSFATTTGSGTVEHCELISPRFELLETLTDRERDLFNVPVVGAPDGTMQNLIDLLLHDDFVPYGNSENLHVWLNVIKFLLVSIIPRQFWQRTFRDLRYVTDGCMFLPDETVDRIRDICIILADLVTTPEDSPEREELRQQFQSYIERKIKDQLMSLRRGKSKRLLRVTEGDDNGPVAEGEERPTTLSRIMPMPKRIKHLPVQSLAYETHQEQLMQDEDGSFHYVEDSRATDTFDAPAPERRSKRVIVKREIHSPTSGKRFVSLAPTRSVNAKKRRTLENMQRDTRLRWYAIEDMPDEERARFNVAQVGTDIPMNIVDLLLEEDFLPIASEDQTDVWRQMIKFVLLKIIDPLWYRRVYRDPRFITEDSKQFPDENVKKIVELCLILAGLEKIPGVTDNTERKKQRLCLRQFLELKIKDQLISFRRGRFRNGYRRGRVSMPSQFRYLKQEIMEPEPDVEDHYDHEDVEEDGEVTVDAD